MEFRFRRYGWRLLLTMLLVSCATTHAGKKYRYPPSAHRRPVYHRIVSSRIPYAAHFFQKGRASWYGRRFHGRRTASGERYNMYALTAAHQTLPLLSYVRVTNLANGKSVVVKINDRGPFSRSRVIDLSYAAATTIGLRRRGVGKVKIQGLTRP